MGGGGGPGQARTGDGCAHNIQIWLRHRLGRPYYTHCIYNRTSATVFLEICTNTRISLAKNAIEVLNGFGLRPDMQFFRFVGMLLAWDGVLTCCFKSVSRNWLFLKRFSAEYLRKAGILRKKRYTYDIQVAVTFLKGIIKFENVTRYLQSKWCIIINYFKY